MNKPLVTIIMPIRNEADYIQLSLKSVLAQDYPSELIEILVVDGMSDDGTRAVVQKIIDERPLSYKVGLSPGGGDQSLPAVYLLDNPGLIVPTALNIGLRHARGDIIVRVDGHCVIAPDYVRRCVEVLEQTGVACVGGLMFTEGKTTLAKAIAAAQSSMVGVGGVAFRTGRTKPGFVDTVAFGAYRSEVFERLGGFDEELVRNQDDEFNFRLTQSGGKIWLDTSIRVIYYSRNTFRSLWRQYFQYSLYKVRLIQKRRAVPSWRHIVPAGFILGLILSLLIGCISGQPKYALAVLGPYTFATISASLWISRSNWRILPLLPIAFIILHFSYGLGFLWGLWYWRHTWR